MRCGDPDQWVSTIWIHITPESYLCLSCLKNCRLKNFIETLSDVHVGDYKLNCVRLCGTAQCVNEHNVHVLASVSWLLCCCNWEKFSIIGVFHENTQVRAHMQNAMNFLNILYKKTSITLHQSIDTLWYVNTEHEDREIWTRRALAKDKDSATPAMIRWLGDPGSETESVPKINGVFPVSAGAICDLTVLTDTHIHTNTNRFESITIWRCRK